MNSTHNTVCAVIVTYKRRPLLGKTLSAVKRQDRPVDHLVVVDNASGDGTAEWVRARHPGVELHALDRNTGGAGGFAHGMRVAHEAGFDWIWVMDDDVAPAPDCLRRLLNAHIELGNCVLVPRRLTPDGNDAHPIYVLDGKKRISTQKPADLTSHYQRQDLFPFEGPLIHRSVIDAVGLPKPGHFIAGDDTLFAVAVYNTFGPGVTVQVNAAFVRRLLPKPVHRSILIPMRAGQSRHVAWYSDDAFWKQAYALRNTHLLWRHLGWRKQQARYVFVHLSRMALDVWIAARRGHAWRRRLKWSWRALVSGVRGQEDAFIDLDEYHREV